MAKKTKTIEIKENNTNHCIYCGKQAQMNTAYYGGHGRDYEDLYYCDCEGAKTEIEMKETIKNIQYEFDIKLRKFQKHGENVIKEMVRELEIQKLEIRLSKLKSDKN